MDTKFSKTDRRYSLRIERELSHPAEKVWRALTERNLLKQWFPADVEGEWTVGVEDQTGTDGNQLSCRSACAYGSSNVRRNAVGVSATFIGIEP